MSFNATLESVKTFEIMACWPTSPCSHDCKITLIDGRTKEVSLKIDRIYALYTAIAREKIFFRNEKVEYCLEWAKNNEWILSQSRLWRPLPSVQEILNQALNEDEA